MPATIKVLGSIRADVYVLVDRRLVATSHQGPSAASSCWKKLQTSPECKSLQIISQQVPIIGRWALLQEGGIEQSHSFTTAVAALQPNKPSRPSGTYVAKLNFPLSVKMAWCTQVAKGCIGYQQHLGDKRHLGHHSNECHVSAVCPNLTT
jgi:hypothetical protein